VAQHHHERHQRPPGAADIDVSEMTPVNLALLTRQAAQPQIGFGFWSRPMAGDDMAKVVGSTRIAALAHHRIQPTGRQLRELLQRLPDEWQVRIHPRWPWRPGARQPRLFQHPPHHAVVHVQLGGDGVDLPFLGVVVAQDLRLDLG
jgi:hypothetical protein